MTKKDLKSNDIVVDGRERVLRNNPDKDRICAQVMERYADQLARAGFFRRIFLRRKISREIERELEKIAPHDALYGQMEIK